MACGFPPQAFPIIDVATPRHSSFTDPPSQRSSRAFWSHHSSVPKGILLESCSKYRVLSKVPACRCRSAISAGELSK